MAAPWTGGRSGRNLSPSGPLVGIAVGSDISHNLFSVDTAVTIDSPDNLICVWILPSVLTGNLICVDIAVSTD